jgi:hypothetical protein
MTDKLEGKELAKVISRSLNSFGFDDTIKECIAELAVDHRTLQQCFTKLCVEWFRALAKDPDRCDGRNEASVKLACLIMELGEDKLALPFI